MAKSTGLGDTIEKITEATGIKTLVEKTTEILGIEDCGCNRRKDWLNELIPYGTTPPIPKEFELDIADFTPGIYIMLDDICIIKPDRQYEYKTGDRVLLNSKNPVLEDFKRLLSMGIIKKE